MAIYWRRKLSGLEAALFAAACAVILAVFLERTLAYMELAERIAMEITVRQVNSGLSLWRATQLLEGSVLERGQALQTNPFELARLRVGNAHPDMEDRKMLERLERRHWVFDRPAQELLYLPQLHRGLETHDSEALVRFHLVMGSDATYALVPAAEYSWH